MLNGLDLFSGIGGITMALAPWVRPVAYCENDSYAVSVLLSRMSRGELPIGPIWDDVRTLKGSHLPRRRNELDIIYGGFPCQDLSIAGAQAGLDGERSRLFFEVVRLACELRPSFVFLENVPAITVGGLDRVCLAFTSLGYDCRWTIVSAAEVGAPHLRERWWFLAHSNGTRLQESWSKQDAKSQRRRQTWDSAFPLVQRDIWKKSPSDICGMDDGLRPKTHRLRALGNAVVPVQARKAFKFLVGFSKEAIQ